MEITTILITLLTTFAATAQDLCDDVYLNPDGSPMTDALGQTFSRYCEWTGPGAPVWDDSVCCTFSADGAECTPADTKGRCRVGQLMYCEFGEQLPGGGVVCYQELVSMCDMGWCVAPPPEPPITQANLACCGPGGACQSIVASEIMDCIEANNVAIFCHHGETSSEGAVTCYD